jgi:uncharacterized protein YjiS (DUF1127 family)
MANVSLDTMRLHRHGVKSLFDRVSGALRDRIRQRAAYSRTLAELNAMSDRELTDFGFHRSELPRVARDAVRGL